MFAEDVDTKERSIERTLLLRPMEGKTVRDVTGLTDPGAFSGGNNLRAIMDENSCLWYMKYDKGILPATLKQKFTSFSALKKFAELYFSKRNIQIVGVED